MKNGGNGLIIRKWPINFQGLGAMPFNITRIFLHKKQKWYYFF